MTARAAGLLALMLAGCERAPAAVEEGAAAVAAVAAVAGAEEGASGGEEAARAPAMVGVLVPESEVVLVAPRTARVERVDVEVGGRVASDAVVAVLDVRGDRTELAAATAAWKAAAAELERLELELERAKAARADVEELEAFVSRAELREQRFAEALAAARRRSAGASVSEQRTRMAEQSARIAESELRAPFAGEIASVYVDAGGTVAAGEPVARLLSDARRVRFAVPEAQSGPLRRGARVDVDFEGGGRGAGAVVAIAPEIEVGSRLIVAEARLDEGGAGLRVGAVGRVRFAEGDPAAAPK